MSEEKAKYKIDLLSVAIAGLALFFTIWQGIETRNHNKLSQRPHLDLSLRASDDAKVRGIRLDNAGIGPAIIKTISFYVEGKPVTLSEVDKKIGKNIWTKVQDDIGWPETKEQRDRILVSTLPKDAWIQHGDALFIFEVDSKLSFDEYLQFKSIEISIDYESMYGEKCRIYFDPKSNIPYTHTPCKSSWL